MYIWLRALTALNLFVMFPHYISVHSMGVSATLSYFSGFTFHYVVTSRTTPRTYNVTIYIKDFSKFISCRTPGQVFNSRCIMVSSDDPGTKYWCAYNLQSRGMWLGSPVPAPAHNRPDWLALHTLYKAVQQLMSDIDNIQLYG